MNAVNKTLSVLVISAVALLGSTIVLAEDGPHDKAIKARQSMFQLYSFNFGILAGMAKGKIDYDAAAAMEAAENLQAVVNLKQSAFWPVGSDNSNAENARTRALPAIWADLPTLKKHAGGLSEAVAAMLPVAGSGLDAMKGAVGDIGGSCKACHDDFRAEKK